MALDKDKIAGLGLTAIPPDAYKDILESGELKMRVATLFLGQGAAGGDLRIDARENQPQEAADRCE